MAALRHLGFIIYAWGFGPPTKVFGSLYRYAESHRNRCSSFNEFLYFASLVFDAHSHHFLGVFAGLDPPEWGDISTKPQKAHRTAEIRHIMTYIDRQNRSTGATCSTRDEETKKERKRERKKHYCGVLGIRRYHTPRHNRFTVLFPGPPRWAGARRELLDFMVQRKINSGRHTDHTAGRHSIRTNQCPPHTLSDLNHFVWRIGVQEIDLSSEFRQIPWSFRDVGIYVALALRNSFTTVYKSRYIKRRFTSEMKQQVMKHKVHKAVVDITLHPRFCP